MISKKIKYILILAIIFLPYKFIRSINHKTIVNYDYITYYGTIACDQWEITKAAGWLCLGQNPAYDPKDGGGYRCDDFYDASKGSSEVEHLAVNWAGGNPSHSHVLAKYNATCKSGTDSGRNDYRVFCLDAGVTSPEGGLKYKNEISMNINGNGKIGEISRALAAVRKEVCREDYAVATMAVRSIFNQSYSPRKSIGPWTSHYQNLTFKTDASHDNTVEKKLQQARIIVEKAKSATGTPPPSSSDISLEVKSTLKSATHVAGKEYIIKGTFEIKLKNVDSTNENYKITKIEHDAAIDIKQLKYDGGKDPTGKLVKDFKTSPITGTFEMKISGDDCDTDLNFYIEYEGEATSDGLYLTGPKTPLEGADTVRGLDSAYLQHFLIVDCTAGSGGGADGTSIVKATDADPEQDQEPGFDFKAANDGTYITACRGDDCTTLDLNDPNDAADFEVLCCPDLPKIIGTLTDPDKAKQICNKTTVCTPDASFPDLCDISTDGFTTAYIHEGADAPSTTKDIKNCVFGNEDLAGNKYDILSGNPYCSVACYEDWEFKLPNRSQLFIKAGAFFALTAQVKGERTCVAGDETLGPEINYDGFLDAVYNLKVKANDGYNKYLRYVADSELRKSSNLKDDSSSKQAFTDCGSCPSGYSWYSYDTCKCRQPYTDTDSDSFSGSCSDYGFTIDAGGCWSSAEAYCYSNKGSGKDNFGCSCNNSGTWTGSEYPNFECQYDWTVEKYRYADSNNQQTVYCATKLSADKSEFKVNQYSLSTTDGYAKMVKSSDYTAKLSDSELEITQSNERVTNCSSTDKCDCRKLNVNSVTTVSSTEYTAPATQISTQIDLINKCTEWSLMSSGDSWYNPKLYFTYGETDYLSTLFGTTEMENRGDPGKGDYAKNDTVSYCSTAGTSDYEPSGSCTSTPHKKNISLLRCDIGSKTGSCTNSTKIAYSNKFIHMYSRDSTVFRTNKQIYVDHPSGKLYSSTPTPSSELVDIDDKYQGYVLPISLTTAGTAYSDDHGNITKMGTMSYLYAISISNIGYGDRGLGRLIGNDDGYPKGSVYSYMGFGSYVSIPNDNYLENYQNHKGDTYVYACEYDVYEDICHCCGKGVDTREVVSGGGDTWTYSLYNYSNISGSDARIGFSYRPVSLNEIKTTIGNLDNTNWDSPKAQAILNAYDSKGDVMFTTNLDYSFLITPEGVATLKAVNDNKVTCNTTNLGGTVQVNGGLAQNNTIICLSGVLTDIGNGTMNGVTALTMNRGFEYYPETLASEYIIDTLNSLGEIKAEKLTTIQATPWR